MVIKDVSPGAIITLGAYPQRAGDRERTPIEWIVLEDSEEGLLILSRHILDCRRYHREFVDVTWRDCDLRRWLNDEFYHSAFTEVEMERINPTRHDGHEDGAVGEDRVFLLSEVEVIRVTAQIAKNFRRARGTEFAREIKPDGCCLYVMDKNVPSDYLDEEGKRLGCSWWWLRDQGRLKGRGAAASRAVFVGTRASIRHYARVNLAQYGVRPAVWLKGP